MAGICTAKYQGAEGCTDRGPRACRRSSSRWQCSCLHMPVRNCTQKWTEPLGSRKPDNSQNSQGLGIIQILPTKWDAAAGSSLRKVAPQSQTKGCYLPMLKTCKERLERGRRTPSNFTENQEKVPHSLKDENEIHNCQHPIKNYLATKKQENITQHQEKNQPTEADPKITQTIKSAEKDIKIATINNFVCPRI